jgi:hypothetical protein
MSISYLKRDSDYRDGIDRMTVRLGGKEVDFRSGVGSILLQSVAKTSNDPQDAESSGFSEEHLEHDVALNACLARFLCVGRTRLIQDFEWLGGRWAWADRLARGVGSDSGTEDGGGGLRFGWRGFGKSDCGDSAESVGSSDEGSAVRGGFSYAG